MFCRKLAGTRGCRDGLVAAAIVTATLESARAAGMDTKRRGRRALARRDFPHSADGGGSH
jgi:hypothetical protein